MGMEFSDTDFPAFYRHDDDVTRWGGPNVDNSYVRARVDGRSTYRLRGNVSGIHDLIISPRNGDMHMGRFGVSADLDSSQMDIAPDGSFKLTLSPEPAPEGVKNWIQLPPDVDHVGIRQYFYDWENETPADFEIVKVGNEGRAPPRVTPELVAQRLDYAARWAEAVIPFWNDYLREWSARVEANTLQPPIIPRGGSQDIRHGGGRFDLAPDEALIIEFDPPQARYWSYQWYTDGWFESPDFANRVTSLNGAQAHTDSDGKVRIVVAHRDPGVQNWLDTEGRRQASINYRYVWTQDEPMPSTRVVPFAEIRRHLPADTPHFDADARREQIAVRQAHVQRRFRR
ncbi:MAG: DUF1214 domain-containing protein [Proteobacteria bacterium]|nr:DUF1214 domain-containing protein [Pseudomonadota bacterium]